MGGGPPGGRGFGRPVTGSAAAKVKAAVLAKYPGTFEQVVAVPGGRYIAHVLQSGNSEVHVLVGSNFQVLGLAPRPSGMPGAGPPGMAPPARPGASS
jgi:hypothetical protein